MQGPEQRFYLEGTAPKFAIFTYHDKKRTKKAYLQPLHMDTTHKDNRIIAKVEENPSWQFELCPIS